MTDFEVVRCPLMRVAFGTDEVTALTAAIQQQLAERGHEVVVVAGGDPWPDVGRRVGEAVAAGRRNSASCAAGPAPACPSPPTRSPACAPRLCTDAETAAGARRWNDANVLALGLRLTSPTVAAEMLDAFL